MMNDEQTSSNELRSTDDSQSVGTLLSRLGDDVASLITTEIHLAKVEVSKNLSDIRKGAASLVFGAVVLLVGLLVLMNGLARTLGAVTEMQPWLSFLIVGGVVTLIGAVLVGNSKSKLSASNLTLPQTEKSLRQDKQVVAEKLS